MRRILLILGVMMGLLVFSSMAVFAQVRQDANISVDLNNISVNPPVMNIQMTMVVSGIHMKSNKALVLQPVFKSSGNELVLPSVFIVGRDKDIAIQRLENKYRAEIDVYEPYVIIKKRKDALYDVNYTVSVPMQNWIRNSELVLRKSMLCCRDVVCANMADMPIYEVVSQQPECSYMDYEFAPRKEIVDSLKYSIYFENDKSDIDLNYMSNRDVLTKLCKNLSDNNLIKVRLLGSASPIGPADLNMQLSKSRAKVVEQYLIDKCNVNPNILASRWIGEDWGDLVEMLTKSDNVNLKLLASTLYNVKGGDQARWDLMVDMLNKSDYDYVNDNYFPYLRSTTAIVVEVTPEFNLSEAISQMNTAPQSMSQQDMLQVASSYTHGSADYIKALKTILKYYPDSQSALVNLSSVYLQSANLLNAKECLDRISDSPLSWNNIGVYYFMKGNDSMAYQYFSKSAEVGNPQAQYNLDKLYYNVMK